MKLREVLSLPSWIKIVTALFLLIMCFYFSAVNYTEPTEVGIARNTITGEMWTQDYGGWHLTSPFVSVSVLDLRPMRVAVLSAGHGYCAKLAQFDKTYWREFIATEGFRYYWFANRISFNLGYEDEYRGQKDLMRGYAFSVKKYPFIKIIKEYQ